MASPRKRTLLLAASTLTTTSMVFACSNEIACSGSYLSFVDSGIDAGMDAGRPAADATLPEPDAPQIDATPGDAGGDGD
jgi:hypothetical protein